MFTKSEMHRFEHIKVDPKKVDQLEMAKAGTQGVKLARNLLRG